MLTIEVDMTETDGKVGIAYSEYLEHKLPPYSTKTDREKCRPNVCSEAHVPLPKLFYFFVILTSFLLLFLLPLLIAGVP